MKQEHTITDFIPILQAYNEQKTMFQVPADIFGHCASICPLRVAIVRLEELNKYWQNQEITTIFHIYHEFNGKVWNDISYEWEFKKVVKIAADNDKIKEFSPITTLND